MPIWGGGLEWDPPHAFGLVFRGMPLHLADRVVAVLHFLTQTGVDKDMFGVRPCSDPSRKKSPAQKAEAVQTRVDSVDSHLRSLRLRFPRRSDFLKLSGISDVSALSSSSSQISTASSEVAQSDVCVVCGDTGLLLRQPSALAVLCHRMPTEPCPLCR